jgi:hypothetical protein
LLCGIRGRRPSDRVLESPTLPEPSEELQVLAVRVTRLLDEHLEITVIP